MIGSTILFSEMIPPAGQEDPFNRWYDEEHIPIRMGAPGFVGAQRYRDGNHYLAVYEMDSTAALKTPEYERIKGQPSAVTARMLKEVSGFTRYIGEQIGRRHRGDAAAMLQAPVLYPVFFEVPEDRCSDFDAWYDQDHVPILMEDERWLGVRRFDLVDATPRPFNRLALHYLADRAVLDSEARKKARATPWRERLASEPWFKGHYMTFDRLERQFSSTR